MQENFKNDSILKTFNLSVLPCFAGLYSIKNLHTGFIYIGESLNIIQGLRSHRSMLERQDHFCRQMQEDANKGGIQIFEVTILVQGPEYESSKIRRAEEKKYIRQIPLEKRYNQLESSGENNGFFGRTHTEEFKERLRSERQGVPNVKLGRPISIPPFRSRKGKLSPGGIFASIAEASAVTGMARRDIRKRIDDWNFTDWRELTQEEIFKSKPSVCEGEGEAPSPAGAKL